MWNPAFYIYLRSNPEKCINRIQKRHRQSEDQISLDYITKLHDLHENAYLWAMAQGVPVVCIDVETKSIEQLGEEVYLALKAVGY
jgi:deoxyadenosine/deoxycytidine kinase